MYFVGLGAAKGRNGRPKLLTSLHPCAIIWSW